MIRDNRLLWLCLVLFVFIILLPASTFAEGDIKVMIEDEYIQFDVQPQIIDGRTLLPLRAIFEALGLEVLWNDETRTITGMSHEKVIILGVDSTIAYVDGQQRYLDVPSKIINGSTLVPVRFIAESLGLNVVWVQESKTILISRDDIIQWSVGGYEAKAPYMEYEVKFVNGIRTDETRYTGKMKPIEVQYKEVKYNWDYPYGLISWEYSLEIPIEAVEIYKSIDRNYIYGYTYYVTHEEDDPYMNSLANVFKNTGAKEDFNDWDMINLAVSFVQYLEYVSDIDGTGYDEYPKFPLETLYDKGGDCEDLSILLASLIRELGYGTVLVVTDNHMGVGIKTSDEGNFQYLGQEYYYIETTAPGWIIGDLPPELDGAAIRILPVF